MDPSIPGVCFTLLAQLGRKAAPGRVLALHTEGLGFKVEGVGFRGMGDGVQLHEAPMAWDRQNQ